MINKYKNINLIWRGSFWIILAELLTRGAGLVVSFTVARILGKEATGIIGIIQSTVVMIAQLAGLGLGTTASKYIPETKEQNPERTGRILALIEVFALLTTLGAGILLLLFAPLIAGKMFNAPALTSGFRIGSLLLVANALAGAQRGALGGFGAFNLITIANICGAITTIIGVLIGVQIAGVHGALWALGGGALINLLVSLVSLRTVMKRENINLNWKEAHKEQHILTKFSLPIVMTSLVIAPANWACNLILVNSAGLQDMAELTVATQWRNLVIFGPQALTQVFLPALAGATLYSQFYNETIKKNLIVILLCGGCVGSLIILMSGAIVNSYGAEFVTGKNVFILMTVSGVLIAVNTVGGTIITSAGEVMAGFYICVITASILVVASFFLVPIYGALGVGIANIMAYSVHSVNQFFVIRYLRKKQRISNTTT